MSTLEFEWPLEAGCAIGDIGYKTDVELTLHYRLADPYAVRIVFPAYWSQDGDYSWVFDLDLLKAAIASPGEHGKGDIKIQIIGDVVMIDRIATFDRARLMLTFETEPILKFFESIESYIPSSEETLANIDDEWLHFHQP